MRLLELKYPIAILSPTSLMGGINAGLNSPRKWKNNVASYYEKGGYDDAHIIDSEGKRYSVVQIYLSNLSLFDKLIASVTTAGPLSESANVDMDLRETDTYTLDRFCSEMRDLALQNPSWWKRHSSKQEISEMFSDCKTFAEAINDIGVLDAPGKEKSSGRSDKIVDLRL